MANEEKLIDVLIVTPNGVQYEHEGQIAVLEAVDGQIGIMAGHEPLVTPLSIGEVHVKRDHEHQQKIDKIAVNGGYVEFSNDVATIVADSAERARDIDIKRAESAKERAERHLVEAKQTKDSSSQARAEVALRRAINRINVYGQN